MTKDRLLASAAGPDRQATDPAPGAVPALSLAGPDATYRAQLDRGVFELQRCDDCGRCQFYPRRLCRFCGSAQWRWIAPCGAATVYATTVVRRKADEGGDHNVAIVELDEGPRMMTRVDGVPAERVSIGMRVSAQVVRENDAALLVFVVAAEPPRHG